MKILFLDCDGVLNSKRKFPTGYFGIDPAGMFFLNHILDETKAQVVISSAWRYLVLGGSMTLEGMEYLFRTHGFGGKIIGRGRTILFSQ